jgi:hypothetical protein
MRSATLLEPRSFQLDLPAGFLKSLALCQEAF